MKTLQGFQKTTMKKLIGPFLSFGIIALFAIPGLAQAQDPGITATQVFGKVTEINSSGGKLVVKTAAGSVVTVNVNEKTTYQRVPPGETSLTKAEPSALTEITVGDGVVARGYVEADRKSVPAQKIFVVSQSEIAKKNAMERAKWSGGVKGVVSAVNPTTKEITVTSRSLMGASQAVTVAVTDKAELKRYPADSLPKYSEAKPSKFEEVKVGDQLNARGEKSADGMHLTAEEIVSGSFKIVGGTITAIDAATGELKINDLTTKKPLTIVIKPDSVIRRFPQGGPMMMGGGGGVNLVLNGTPVYAKHLRVSEGFSRVLGVVPVKGRWFNANEDKAGGPQVTVLSFTAWQRYFASAEDVIGRSVLLRGEPHQIVGVMPAGFRSLDGGEFDLWVPLRPSTSGEGGGDKGEGQAFHGTSGRRRICRRA